MELRFKGYVLILLTVNRKIRYIIVLLVLFWELISRKSLFDFETKSNDLFEIFKIKSDILNGKREKPLSGTNYNLVALYKIGNTNHIKDRTFIK
ncbi:unnamed protein product [Rhizophagus irregularis]|uniref:Uncharacterized protein n=1 Tax=Rhizophagus irregularis TaxID=588596 RepID=A0A915Z2F2_9GLOM|nr:unnamed protein product [Rhizophagus irregularis]